MKELKDEIDLLNLINNKILKENQGLENEIKSVSNSLKSCQEENRVLLADLTFKTEEKEDKLKKLEIIIEKLQNLNNTSQKEEESKNNIQKNVLVI